MSTNSTTRPRAEPVASDRQDTGTNWAAIDALTDEQALAAALADPDAQPLTEAQLSRARGGGLGAVIRFRVGLTLVDFEARYSIPAETIRGWERGTSKPDAAMLAYVTLIDADPEGVAAALAKARRPAAAE